MEEKSLKDVKHTETALAQETAELQIPGDSAAVSAPKSSISACSAFLLCPGDLLLVSMESRTLPWAFALAAVALDQISAEGIPLASSHQGPSGFKAKREESQPTIQKGIFRKTQM